MGYYTSIAKRLKEDTEYQKFFMAALDKFGVKSPSEFSSEDKKKEFFNYVDKNYKGKNESALREDFFPPHGQDTAEEKEAKRGLANFFNNMLKTGKLGKRDLDILNDLIEDYAEASSFKSRFK